jgi:signal transduction histidine kinase
VKKTKKKKSNAALTLPQATRRFTKQVKYTVLAMLLLLIASMVGTTAYGNWLRQYTNMWTDSDQWSWVASTPYAQYDYASWTPCTRPLGETAQVTLAQLADNIQHKVAQYYATDSFYVAIYDENWNLVTSSDNYEITLYPNGCDGTYNPWCQYNRTTNKTLAMVAAAKSGHSHSVLIDEPVPFDFAVRTERAKLPGWFNWLAKRNNAPAFIQNAIQPETAKDALMVQWRAQTEEDRAYVESGQFKAETGDDRQWEDFAWQVYPPTWVNEEKTHYGVKNLACYEKIYLRPQEVAQPPENLVILAHKYAVEENPAFTQFYAFEGDLYSPVLNDQEQWYESQPGDAAQIFYVCTAGVYSPVYAAAAETIRNFSPSYLLLFALFILLLIGSIFIEYRMFSAVQRRTIQAQRDLLVTIAHELKTPMGVVMLYGEKVEHGQDKETMQQDAHALHAEIRRMNTRLMDVLTLSRLDNMPGMPTEPLALGELLEDVADTFTPLLNEKEIALQTALQPDVTIEANPFYIRTAAHNYLSNAMKFAPQGGQIKLRLTCDGKKARVSVWNNGAPIDDKDGKDIWGCFNTICDDGDNKNKGTGLGLSIVRSIVQLHDGRYGFTNQPDGVTFWLELPIRKKKRQKNTSGKKLKHISAVK